LIVGCGMMAQAFAPFRNDQGVLIFASGVSDSLETRPSEFAREKSLLAKARSEHPDKLLVYFGTCSVEDPDRARTPYVAHKIGIESLLEDAGSPWMVLRLPLAVGPDRKGHTLAPFLYQRISRGERFEVWEHATRYPVDVADVLRIAQRFISTRALWSRRINVALRAFPVLEFVRVMQSIVGRRALYDLVPKGGHYPIHCPEVAALAQKLNLDLSDRYLECILRKYFSDR
jgi:nucleoside-diphosphate-sugar epimerase